MNTAIVIEIIGLISVFIGELSSKPVYEMARKRSRDFTREKSGKGKLPLHMILAYYIFRHSKDTSSESAAFWGDIDDMKNKPSRQDINKRMKLVNPKVWPYLSKEFARLYFSCDALVRTLKGYVVFASDSSAVEMPYSQAAADMFGFHKSNHVKKASDSGKVIARCGGLLDVMGRYFVDYVIEPYVKSECDILVEQLHAFISILNHRKTIILADRGYFSLALMAIAQNLGYKFCIRAQKKSYKKYVSRMKSDDDYIEIKLTKAVLSRVTDEEAMKYLTTLGAFRVRVIRKYVSNPETGAEELCVYFTNLTAEDFSTQEIIDLYCRRWTIETAYEGLKTGLELERHVSADPSVAINDIYAKILYYNICSVVSTTVEIEIENTETDQRIPDESCEPAHKHKYVYKIAVKKLLSQMYHERLVQCFILGRDIEAIITQIIDDLMQMKNQLKTPIRPGRHYNRWGKMVTASYKYKFSIDGRNHPKVAFVNGAMRTVKP